MTEKRKNKHLGSSFDAYLVEEGLYEDATSVAWKRVLSWEVSEDATLTSIVELKLNCLGASALLQ